MHVTFAHPRNAEMKGDPLHLQVPFAAQINFKQTKSVQSDWSSDARLLSRLDVQNVLPLEDVVLLAELQVLVAGSTGASQWDKMCRRTFRSRVTFVFLNVSKRLVV